MVFGILAWRYKARIDKQLAISSACAGVLFVSMLIEGKFAALFQPLIAIAMVRNVHLFISQIRRPTINQSKRDYGMTVIVALLGFCFGLSVVNVVFDMEFGAQTLFLGILVAHGVAIIADSAKESSTSFPALGVVIYGLGIAIPQLFGIILGGDYGVPASGAFSAISLLSVTAGLILMRMDEALQLRENLLRAESSLAREQVSVVDLQMSITLSRVLSNAAHSLGTPSVILGGLRDVISRKGVVAVEGRIIDSLTMALEKIAESKRRISEVNELIEVDNREGIDVDQMIADVIRLFEHSLSGVDVNIHCESLARARHLKSVLLHLLITQITIHTLSLQKMGVNDRPRLDIVVAVNDGWMTLKVFEGGRANSVFEGLDTDQLKLQATMESVLESVGGSVHINSGDRGALASQISIEIR